MVCVALAEVYTKAYWRRFGITTCIQADTTRRPLASRLFCRRTFVCAPAFPHAHPQQHITRAASAQMPRSAFARPAFPKVSLHVEKERTYEKLKKIRIGISHLHVDRSLMGCMGRLHLQRRRGGRWRYPGHHPFASPKRLA